MPTGVRIPHVPDPRTAPTTITRVVGTTTHPDDDVIVIEEPLEIRAAWDSREAMWVLQG